MLHNWVDPRRVERYKVNLTSRNQDPIHASLALSSLLSVWYEPNSPNNKSIYNTLLLEFYICSKPRLTHWYPCPKKKVPLLLHRGVHMFILTKDSCDCTGSCGNGCDLVWMSVYITMYLEFLFIWLIVTIRDLSPVTGYSHWSVSCLYSILPADDNLLKSRSF